MILYFVAAVVDCTPSSRQSRFLGPVRPIEQECGASSPCCMHLGAQANRRALRHAVIMAHHSQVCPINVHLPCSATISPTYKDEPFVN